MAQPVICPDLAVETGMPAIDEASILPDLPGKMVASGLDQTGEDILVKRCDHAPSRVAAMADDFMDDVRIGAVDEEAPGREHPNGSVVAEIDVFKSVTKARIALKVPLVDDAVGNAGTAIEHGVRIDLGLEECVAALRVQ
jgi:hypothetical protein